MEAPSSYVLSGVENCLGVVCRTWVVEGPLYSGPADGGLRVGASESGWQKALFPGILGGSSGLHGLPTLRWYCDLSGGLCLQNMGGGGASLLGFWGGRGRLMGKNFRVWVTEGSLSWHSGWEFWASCSEFG